MVHKIALTFLLQDLDNTPQEHDYQDSASLYRIFLSWCVGEEGIDLVEVRRS